MKVRVRLLAAAALVALAPQVAGAQAPTAPSALSPIDAHMAAAKIAAGVDFKGSLGALCIPSPPGRGGPIGVPGAPGAAAIPLGAPRPTPDRATWYAPPYKVFDNLYWLGSRQFSSWALKTSAGIILLDTNFNYAIEPEIVDGMKALGLDPAQVNYVVISHAHGDHDEGARLFQERYGAHVVLSAADWDSIVKQTNMAGGPPVRDIVATDGMKLTLGDTTVTLVTTPGHTPGTLSFVFPVKNGGKAVTVAYSGGTLTGAFGSNAALWDQYIASQKKISQVATDMGATVILSNHSEYDGALTKARLLTVPRLPGEENPFIVGTAGVQRYFTVMVECAEASKLRAGAR